MKNYLKFVIGLGLFLVFACSKPTPVNTGITHPASICDSDNGSLGEIHFDLCQTWVANELDTFSGGGVHFEFKGIYRYESDNSGLVYYEIIHEGLLADGSVYRDFRAFTCNGKELGFNSHEFDDYYYAKNRGVRAAVTAADLSCI